MVALGVPVFPVPEAPEVRTLEFAVFPVAAPVFPVPEAPVWAPLIAHFEVISLAIVPFHLVSPLVTFASAGTPLLIVTEVICF